MTSAADNQRRLDLARSHREWIENVLRRHSDRGDKEAVARFERDLSRAREDVSVLEAQQRIEEGEALNV